MFRVSFEDSGSKKVSDGKATCSVSERQSTLSPELEGLVQILKDDSSDVRSCAAMALSGQSTLPAEILKDLVQVLKDNNSNVGYSQERL